MKDQLSFGLRPANAPSRLYVTGGGQLIDHEVAEKRHEMDHGWEWSGQNNDQNEKWTDEAIRIAAEDLRKDAAFRLFLGNNLYKKEVAIPFHRAFWGHRAKIKDLVLKSNDFKGATLDSRNMAPDIVWQEPNTKSVFLTEMQRERQLFYGDRVSLYEGKARCLFAIKGIDWDFQQVPIHVLGLADFDLNRKNRMDYIHEFISTNQKDPEELFCGKDWKMLIDLPKFRKAVPENYSERDKWLFILNNFHNLRETPTFLKGGYFEDVIEIAKQLNQTKMEEFMNMLDDFHWRDRVRKLERLTKERVEENAIAVGRTQGRAEGIIEGKAEGKAEGLIEGEVKGTINTIKSFLAANPNLLKKSVKDVAAMFQVDEQLVRPLMA